MPECSPYLIARFLPYKYTNPYKTRRFMKSSMKFDFSIKKEAASFKAVSSFSPVVLVA
jgi:hypothetical protein